VPDVLKLKCTILQELHDANYSGHAGYQRTVHNVQRLYWLPSVYSEICESVKGCLPGLSARQAPAQIFSWQTRAPAHTCTCMGTCHSRPHSQPAKDREGLHCHTSGVRQALQDDTLCSMQGPVYSAKKLNCCLVTLCSNTMTCPCASPQAEVQNSHSPTSSLLRRVKIVGTMHCKSTVCYHLSDEQTERMDRVLEDTDAEFQQPKAEQLG